MPEYPGAYFFLSDQQTGTGSAQQVAHTMGKVPERVFAFLTGGPSSYTQPSIVLGTPTDENLVATVTTNWKYRLVAWG